MAPVLGSSEIDARNPERFFIGSRYGKRSGEERNYILDSNETHVSFNYNLKHLEVLPPADDVLAENSPLDKDVALECIPTGIEQLFHCTK